MPKKVYIDADDEITSVIDKIKDLPNKELVMIIPKRATLIQSIVNLKLLKKQTDELKKDMVLIITDETGRNLASRAGFITKKDLNSTAEEPQKEKEAEKLSTSGKEALTKHENKSTEEFVSHLTKELTNKKDQETEQVELEDVVEKIRDREETGNLPPSVRTYTDKETTKQVKGKRVVLLPTKGIKVFFIFVLFSLLITGVIGFIVLPKAEIIVTPKTEQVIANYAVKASEEYKDVDVDLNEIPGKKINISKESSEKEFSATNKTNLEIKAKGTITVTNSYSSDPQVLVAGTRFVSTDNKQFNLIADTTIPGAAIRVGKTIAGTKNVEVEASEPGEDYNIEPTSFTIPGLDETKQSTIVGSSTKAFSGGEVREALLVSANDLEKAKEELTNNIIENINDEIKNEVGSEYYYFAESLLPNIELETSVKVDDEIEKFKAKAKANINTIVFQKSSLEEYINKKIDGAINKNQYLVGEILDHISFTEIKYDEDKGILEGTIYVDKTIAYNIENEKIQSNLKGKSLDEANSILDNMSEIDGYTVNLWPFWVESVPTMENKIDIIINES
ncbi:MAG: hypothetical protein ABIE68_02190 [bacterium]